ncbi:uncharacterized protein LOC106866736 [Brachypodium distachyon]|uniref:Uncharacterized protein n=1 Tax=Brachypodium distachyon TaxID=15368 RepID=A0A2K2CTJ0_BRADI|nr:uncharacterized protein LOC106866736 [Brachypodium distachyon]PNT65343.1 hypothetical protein BRADI_4g40908v3 [Brachypodium distachyon]|eukprot:XP_024311126.1 uncharacterized protein LOC106866736 [Brachypodium distachyon]
MQVVGEGRQRPRPHGKATAAPLESDPVGGKSRARARARETDRARPLPRVRASFTEREREWKRKGGGGTLGGGGGPVSPLAAPLFKHLHRATVPAPPCPQLQLPVRTRSSCSPASVDCLPVHTYSSGPSAPCSLLFLCFLLPLFLSCLSALLYSVTGSARFFTADSTMAIERRSRLQNAAQILWAEDSSQSVDPITPAQAEQGVPTTEGGQAVASSATSLEDGKLKIYSSPSDCSLQATPSKPYDPALADLMEKKLSSSLEQIEKMARRNLKKTYYLSFKGHID